jgi:DNA-binding transcriptional regulator YdaS (Cro superfamily)
MRLLDYLPKRFPERMRALEALAKKVDSSAGYLNLVALGHKLVGYKMADKIAVATNGQVTKSDLRPDIWPLVSKPARKRAA